jgi:long-chain acyl-CoA synthetase
LLEDIAELKPTFFPSVPRLFNRIYAKVMAATLDAGGIKGTLFQRAYADKLYNLKHEKTLSHYLWDRLLFSKVKALLGGRVKYMLTGSAPISKDVLTFLRVFFSCEVLEGIYYIIEAFDSTNAPQGTEQLKPQQPPPCL